MRMSPRRLVASLAVGTGLVYYVLSHIDGAATLNSISGAEPAYLGWATVFLVAAYALRPLRWLLWDRSSSYAESAKAILVGFMGNNVLPARLGEVLRADWTVGHSREGHGRTSVLASVAAERILDGLALAILAVLGLALSPVASAFSTPIIALAVVFTGLAGLMALSLTHHERIRQTLDRLNRFFPGHLTAIGKSKANYALDGFVRLGSTGAFTLALVLSAVIWGLEVVFYWLIGAAVFPISFGTSLIFVAVVNFASLFPLTVGGIGAIESAATAFLISAGVPAPEALGMVLIQHTMQLVFTTTLGGAVFLTNSRKQTVPEAEIVAARLAVEIEDPLDGTQRTLDALHTEFELVAPADRSLVSLTIVIPSYNERQRLPRTALETIRWCNTHLNDYEIIIADDGSSDDTLMIAELLRAHDRNVRILACPHLGKGAAVRMGMLNAGGQYVLFMDADGATPLTEIPKLIDELAAGHQVAIGSRVLQGPGDITVETSLHRRIIGRAFALFVNVFAISGIADTQCGFKMFRREAVRPVFGRQKLSGFAFDVEILFIARRLGFSISEVPVNWQNQAGSKVNLVTDSLAMLWDLTHIRWLHRGERLSPSAVPMVGDRART
jgi:dolichyl-phosphate beta-glucosyltransferase